MLSGEDLRGDGEGHGGTIAPAAVSPRPEAGRNHTDVITPM
jgi:hypothetical protein